MEPPQRAPLDVAEAISQQSLTLADSVADLPECSYTLEELRERLQCLLGEELAGANRSRSKRAKQLVAKALGYGEVTTFKRTAPRFLGADLDVYVQESDNLQVWNEEVSPARRYVIIRPVAGVIKHVVVTTGADLAQYDKTGTLTGKQQAKRKPGHTGSVCVGEDTENMTSLLGDPATMEVTGSVGDLPQPGRVLPLAILHERLLTLIGKTFLDPGPGQERRRGEALQQLVVEALKVGEYHNPAQWPDVTSQALEVKLQTAPTIDLGNIDPAASTPTSLGSGILTSDVRWAIVYVTPIDQGLLQVSEVVSVAGSSFFDEFRAFGGKGTNKKIQLKLPSTFFAS